MTQAKMPRLSVVITCYNYEAFVADAINSIRAQDTSVDIVVVDDCSSDNSRQVITGFEGQVTPVLQDKNLGHGGGFNAGFAATDPNTELVMFLDADDFLLPGAVATILDNFDQDTVIYHYRMRYADECGNLAGVHPSLRNALAAGDLSKKLREVGRYYGQITSGLVFSRSVLEKVLPMNSENYRQGGDGYLSAVVPLYGKSKSFDEAISGYRLHGMQHSKFQAAYAKRARWRISHDYERYRSIREHSKKLGLTVAEDLAARDSLHLEERIVSLLFDPAKHPISEDAIATLVRRVSELPDPGRTFWKILRISPTWLKQMLLRWKIDPQTRPKALATIGRMVRNRAGNF